jgi:hypothetical protein
MMRFTLPEPRYAKKPVGIKWFFACYGKSLSEDARGDRLAVWPHSDQNG